MAGLPAIVSGQDFAQGDATAEQDAVKAEDKESAVVPVSEETAVQGEDAESVTTPTEAQQRVLRADEDPMAASAAQREVKRSKEKKGETQRTTGFDIYGSIRVRYRDQGSETDWQDGSSRIGADADWRFRRGSFLFGRYEAGFNALTGLQGLSAPGEQTGEFEDSIFRRLAYVGLDARPVLLVAGKNWSTYYEVSGFTDRFNGTGGSASGTYNAQTDGGPTGPGRADDTVQTKLSFGLLPHKVFEPFDLNLQFQHGNPIPFGSGVEYGTAVGVSAVMKMREKNFSLGIAYNHADIDLANNPSLGNIGITGSARALLLGTRAFGDRWYAALVVARLENHETTDDGIYFHGWGSEFYGKYHLFDRLWLVGGFNSLEPDSDQAQARAYRVKYAVLELEYIFNDAPRLIFANVRFNDDVSADGTTGSNVYTIGVRWDLSKRGWHASN